MRSLSGLVLLAGLGVGLFVYLPAPGDSSLTLDASHRLSTTMHRAPPPVRTVEPAAARTERTFSPNISLASFKPSSSVTVIRPTATGTQRDASGGWNAVVSATGSATQASGAALTPSSPQSRYELIVQIQQQLKRVGCYYGRVDGSWGAGSKEAMRTFTQRVNAELPIDEPDYLLLSLLQAQSGKTCGECPPGLALSADGRCVAPPAYAQTPSAGTGEVLPWKSAATTAQTPTASPAPLFRPVSTSVVSSEPLPGRMAIGGPKELPPVSPYNASSAYTPAGERAPASTAALDSTSGEPAHASRPAPATTQRRAKGRGTPRHDPIRQNLLLSLGGAY